MEGSRTLYCGDGNDNDNIRFGESLHVTYTNDPISAWKWTEQHLSLSSSSTATTTTTTTTNSQLKVDPTDDDEDEDEDDDEVATPEVAAVVVGFDMESSPRVPWREKGNQYTGPATVQLSVFDAALVLQIAQEGYGPYEGTVQFLQSIFSSPSLIFAGVGIDEDLIELHRWNEHIFADLPPPSSSSSSSMTTTALPRRVDLGGMGGPVDDGSNKNNSNSKPTGTVGLQRLTRGVLGGLELEKSKRIARSPWADAPLTGRQLEYAARDAWAAVAIVHRLRHLDPTTFSPGALMDILADEDVARTGRGYPVSIPGLSDRARKRRAVKNQWRELVETQRDASTSSWTTQAQRSDVDALYRRMAELAPPPCIRFDLQSLLGIDI
jgi:hypothetical protein